MSKIKINFKKQEVITLLFAMVCLMLFINFPAKDAFQYNSTAFIFLMALPFVYDKYILRKKTVIDRMKLGDWRKGLLWVVGSIVVALLFVALVFRFTDLLDHYALPIAARDNFWQFLSYELLGIALNVALYEIFFRGFVMFYFEENFGKWVIFFQAAIFYLMLTIFYLPFAFIYLYIIFAPFSGLISYKTRSIVYSFVGQLFFIIIADASAIALLSKLQ